MSKQDQRIQLVASSEFRQEVDKWRRDQTDLPSHSESIRRLVRIALRLEKGETMKLLTAIIRPHKYNDVRDALISIGIEGLSATEIKGFGRQRGQTEIYRGAEYKTTEIPKIKIELVVPTERLEEVIEVITKTSETGKVGDGKIFVSDIDRAVRIRTGETQEDAL
ncbi:MAG: P-II family nitrogen regulator [Pseudomonadota bacterium]|nr:P-II family nitrogen regulator [Pseudomonadota bacterium]MEC7734689.1 P-II family nitrogen regulator [Pseudomonadota bacterium]MEC9392364.1 P-II family nitrogen regulator [Pseudomonadota bacterium]MEC9458597.1 P-II family nitrogen regulator [Pseudomonadota bacterium]MED5437385.1 P-II family nitrogen regulator [Pseudomonadota bacterium]